MIYAGIALLIMLGTYGGISIAFDAYDMYVEARRAEHAQKRAEHSERMEDIEAFGRQATRHAQETWVKKAKSKRILYGCTYREID